MKSEERRGKHNRKKVKKCWYCENVNKCEKLEPCGRYKKWVNPHTITAFCRRHKIPTRNISRWLTVNPRYARLKVSEKYDLKVFFEKDEDSNLWEIYEDV